MTSHVAIHHFPCPLSPPLFTFHFGLPGFPPWSPQCFLLVIQSNFYLSTKFCHHPVPGPMSLTSCSMWAYWSISQRSNSFYKRKSYTTMLWKLRNKTKVYLIADIKPWHQQEITNDFTFNTWPSPSTKRNH